MNLIDKLDAENQKKLNEIISNTTRYAHIYKSEKNAQIAQMWFAIMELHKMQELMREKIKKLERALKEKKGSEVKEKKSDLLTSLENY